MSELLISVLAVGGAFMFFASGFALLRLPDLYTRLHGPTKAASLGLALIAAAAMLADGGRGLWTEKLMILLFVCLTLPVSSQVLVSAALRRGCEVHPSTRGEAPDPERSVTGSVGPRQERSDDGRPAPDG